MILMAGPGIPLAEGMELQVYNVNRAMGMMESQAKMASSMSKKIYDFINNYKGSEIKSDVSDYMKSLNPFMNEQALNTQVKQLTNPWYLYFIGFNPDRYLSQTKIPVLAFNGSLDVQVISKENLQGISKSLEKARNKNFEVLEFEGLNHLFQIAKTGSDNEYGEIEETIAPQVLEKISEWIKTINK